MPHPAHPSRYARAFGSDQSGPNDSPAHCPHRRLDEVSLSVEFVPGVVCVVRIAAPHVAVRLLAGYVSLNEPLQDDGEILPLRVTFEREHRRLREIALEHPALHAETVPAVRNPAPFQTIEPVGPEPCDFQR